MRKTIKTVKERGKSRLFHFHVFPLFFMVGLLVVAFFTQVGQHSRSPVVLAEEPVAIDPWQKPQRPYSAEFIRDGAHTLGVGGEKVLPWVCPISQEELDLLAAIVYAEAGDQGYRGMQLVCDVILNRVSDRHPEWPNTITEVVYQPYQFSPVLDGGLDRAWGRVTQECYDAVLQELQGQIDYDIIYFSMYGCQNGRFVYQYLDHYFGV